MRAQVQAAVVAVALLAAPLPAGAQQSRTLARYGDWSVTAVGSGDDVSLAAGTLSDSVYFQVSCVLGDYLVVLDLHDGIFNDGLVTAAWDDGTVEQFTFLDGDRILSASTWTGSDRYVAGLGAFVAKLKARSELHLRVRRFPDIRIADRISLRGSGRAIDALGCG